MPLIPRDEGFDSTLALLRDPYEFIAKRCRRYRSDLFQTRLLLRATICMTGPETAELFYDESRLRRRGAAPGRVQDTLFRRGGVQGRRVGPPPPESDVHFADGPGERIAQLEELTARWWTTCIHGWAAMGRVVLYGDVREILRRAVCVWACVPLHGPEVGCRMRN